MDLTFNMITWIAVNAPIAGFDFNGIGRIDFADIVWLFIISESSPFSPYTTGRCTIWTKKTELV